MASAPTPDPPRLQSFTLGDWLVDPRACQISRGEEVVKLRPQLVDVLLCLARRAGQIVLKEEILAEVWPGQFIADSGLSRCVAELRRILQDDAQAPRFIETIPKRGYRMAAAVAWLPSPEGQAPPASGVAVPAEAAAGLGPDLEASAPSPAAPTPVPVAALDAEEPLSEARSPTARRWRRAVIALALLAAAVAATLWLVRARPSQVLTDRDPVLLAFENRTGDAVFDQVIPLAMSVQLEQSPHLALLSPGRIAEVLQMMKRPPDTAITRAIGLEVCERAGARAVIVTSIASLGRQYAIGLEAVGCGTGEVLARRQVTADGKEHVLAGLQRAAGDIRAAVGEPAASLARYNVPIVEATTASLEALRALSQGDLAWDRGEFEAALGCYRQAVALDPDFALGQSRLGASLRGLGTKAESAAALERAYALRERVTFPERLEIEVDYHHYQTGDGSKKLAALELLARTYPQRAGYRSALGAELIWLGHHERALAEAQEARRLEPNSGQAGYVVSFASLSLNRISEARAAAEQTVAAGVVAPLLHLMLFQCALATGDADLLARERAWAAGQGEIADIVFLESEAEDAMSRGRLRVALEFLSRYETLSRTRGSSENAANLRLRMARFEALSGRREEALQRVREEVERGVPPGQTVDAAMTAATAGDLQLTSRLLDEFEARGPSAAQPQAAFATTYRAVLDAASGRFDGALARLAPLEEYDLGFRFSLNPLYERARIHFLAGDWPRARAAFEKILAHPTIDSGKKLIPSAQVGLARTLARAGDIAGARQAYERFFERLRDADPDLPLLLEARRELAALPK